MIYHNTRTIIILIQMQSKFKKICMSKIPRMKDNFKVSNKFLGQTITMLCLEFVVINYQILMEAKPSINSTIRSLSIRR